MTASRAGGRERVRGHAALVAVQVSYGLFPLAVHLGVEAFDPGVLVGWRLTVGALVFGVLALARHGREALPARGDLPRLVACALFGVALNQTLAVRGMSLTSTTEAGLLMTLIPIFTFGLAVLVRQERFVPLRALGVLVALGGALLLRGDVGTDPARALQPSVGNLFIAGNTLAYSLYLVLARPLLARYPAVVVVAWLYVLSLWAVPVVAGGGSWVPAGATPRSWLALGYVLLLPTLVAYFLNAYALARLRASTTAVYVYLQPFVAGLAGALVLGERASPGTAAAAGLLFVGIALVARRPEPRPWLSRSSAE